MRPSERKRELEARIFNLQSALRRANMPDLPRNQGVVIIDDSESGSTYYLLDLRGQQDEEGYRVYRLKMNGECHRIPLDNGHWEASRGEDASVAVFLNGEEDEPKWIAFQRSLIMGYKGDPDDKFTLDLCQADGRDLQFVGVYRSLS